MVSGFNVNALSELKKYLGLNSPVEVKDVITQMAVTREDIIDLLKVDHRYSRENTSSIYYE